MNEDPRHFFCGALLRAVQRPVEEKVVLAV